MGTTLWSFIPDEAKVEVSQTLNDYKTITLDGSQKVTVEDTNKWHAQEKLFIEQVLLKLSCIMTVHYQEINSAKAAGETVVVLTHHAPVINLCSSPGDNYNCAVKYEI